MCAAPARRRLVWAVAGSLMLHVVGLAVLWRTPAPLSARPPLGVRVPPPAMLWVAIAPPPTPVSTAVVPGETGEKAGAHSVPLGARGHATAAIVRPLPSARVRPSTASPEIEAPVTTVLSMPSRPASTAQPQAAPAPAPAPAPGSDAVVRALERERAWQRRQGLAHVPQTWGSEAPVTMGAGAVMRDLRGPGGSRTTKVSGPWGDYCVELPSANQPPAMGAAPRMALARTCR